MCVSSLNVTLTSFPERNGRKWKTFQQETERGRERERERERCNEGDVLFFSNHRNVAEFWFDIPTHEVSRVRIRASFESRSWRRVTQASNTRTKAQPNVNGVVGTFAVAFRVLASLCFFSFKTPEHREGYFCILILSWWISLISRSGYQYNSMNHIDGMRGETFDYLCSFCNTSLTNERETSPVYDSACMDYYEQTTSNNLSHGQTLLLT